MPLLLESLDAVAVRLGRDLLFFGPSPMIAGDERSFSWIDSESALALRDWFDQEGIGYGVCGPFSNSGWIEGGPRCLYLELPYDPDDFRYQRLCNFVEDHGGQTRWPETRFSLLSLELAERLQAESDVGGFD